MTDSPLAERLRPQKIDDLLGQDHLTGEHGVIRKVLKTGTIPSMIFWGPPGTGKTTLANLIADELHIPFYSLSAISSGVKEVREVIAKARMSGKALLFIDEIHRFNKSQQDALLASVEKGYIVLIGATTENPSFEVNSALLSRCQVYILNSLSREDLKSLLERAMKNDTQIKELDPNIEEYDALFQLSGGDARKLLNIFELVVMGLQNDPPIIITNEKAITIAQQKVAIYDKGGEQHYDIISAFIKSLRGGDPNAAVYWLARMLEGGEDIKFIARRMVILASEDIGNANPTALVIATNCFQAVNMVGMPESRIILSQCAVYLACSPKSNASYEAINSAMAVVRQTGDLSVPLHIRNAPTKLMKNLDYGKGYKYGHAYKGNFVQQDYLPDEINNKIIYDPGNNPRENEFRNRLKNWWEGKYDY